MNQLWIFNPENDIALGNNLHHFTPPRNASLLRQHGSLLPIWIADNHDIVVADSSNTLWLKEISEILNKDIEILSPNNIKRIESVKPWGWSNAIASEVKHLGIPTQLIPNSKQIENIRALSHRRSSVIINRKLAEIGFDVTMPIEVSDIQKLQAYLKQKKSVVIKSPWSSSGRGVIYSDSLNHNRLLELAAGMIKHQGSILIEEKLNKTIDFAMLFNIDGGAAKYIGLSVFDTLAGGNYTGNIIGSEQYLTDLICHYIKLCDLQKLVLSLESILSDLIGLSYTGICGIDMMVHTLHDGSHNIAPCIELNLRNTMGYVAHCLARDILSHKITGRMTITYTGASQISPNDSTIPPHFDTENRLTSGTLQLVPNNPFFNISLTANPDYQ